MTRLLLDDAQAGMVLANDALSPSGDVLLGKGTSLTEKHLQRLRQYDCTSIVIADEEDASETADEANGPTEKPALSEATAKKLEILEHTFSDVQDNSQMQMIQTLVRNALIAGDTSD